MSFEPVLPVMIHYGSDRADTFYTEIALPGEDKWVLARFWRNESSEEVILGKELNHTYLSPTSCNSGTYSAMFTVDGKIISFEDIQMHGDMTAALFREQESNITHTIQLGGIEKIGGEYIKVWVFAPGYIFCSSWIEVSVLSKVYDLKDPANLANVTWVKDGKGYTLKSIYIPNVSPIFKKKVTEEPESRIQTTERRFTITNEMKTIFWATENARKISEINESWRLKLISGTEINYTEVERLDSDGLRLSFEPAINGCSQWPNCYSTITYQSLFLETPSGRLAVIKLEKNGSKEEVMLAREKFEKGLHNGETIEVNGTQWALAEKFVQTTGTLYQSLENGTITNQRNVSLAEPIRIGNEYLYIWAFGITHSSFWVIRSQEGVFSEIMDLVSPENNVELEWENTSNGYALKSIYIPASSPIFHELVPSSNKN